MTQMVTPASFAAPPKPVVGVGIVIIRPNAPGLEVLLIRRGKPPGEGIWSIPGGKQEFGESVREAAIREAREETGLEIGNLRLIDVVDVFAQFPDGSPVHWTLIEFRADWQSGEAMAGSDAAAVQWVPLSAIPTFGLWDETARIILAGAALA